MTKINDVRTMLEYEKEATAVGNRLVAGVDEVGRGPLAGPVVTACVIMPLDEESLIMGVNDSKKLSEKTREKLYSQIIEKAIAYRIAVVDEKVIDEINILNATKKAMTECVENISKKPDIVLVDAVKLDLSVPSIAIIKGDAKSYSIACASIVAKVYRDNMMKEYAKTYPEYGFDKNKGYGTKDHIDALKKYGATPLHRKTFITHFVQDE